MALSNLFGWNNKESAGSACGASDKPAACGTACGAGDSLRKSQQLAEQLVAQEISLKRSLQHAVQHVAPETSNCNLEREIIQI